ncbi:putative Fe-S oxidoreductase [Thermoplasmatales archaeon SCGC AB-539-N05]|nr:putative Fe-S oxidoreductase [Thermoplasmatales archaeon SCGC AB-539-N05]
MIDPFKEAERVRKIVCQNDKRKYYRFRGGRFYGGIAAADCVGCIIDCTFCWSQEPRKNPARMGQFYSAKAVASKLTNIAIKNGYDKVRITGNEPTLCKQHLLRVMSLIPDDFLFILETNGILIDEGYAKDLSRFKNLHVRVSLKGSNKVMFSKITNARPEYFNFQLQALRHLIDHNVSCNAAIMYDLLTVHDISEIKNWLTEIHSLLAQHLEFESLIKYPFVLKNLKQRGIKF